MEREPVLVILAAGMGSRYGGLKQIDPVGRFGEKILDYSLYDAKRAGFKKALFVIKEELLPDFEEAVFAKARTQIEVAYVFQKLSDVPAGFTVPEGREKPWGTGHAALTAGRAVGGAPYAVINADDFYGREGLSKIYDFLRSAPDGDPMDLAMVGYWLRNTVTDHGSVSRGVCQVADGTLQGITERLRIEKRPAGEIAYTEDGGETWVPLAGDTVVSMNLFGFTPGFTQALEDGFQRFFQETVAGNPLKAEFLLPSVVNELLDQGRARMAVLPSGDKWYGVTYREDKPQVAAGLQALADQGVYPSPLWG